MNKLQILSLISLGFFITLVGSYIEAKHANEEEFEIVCEENGSGRSIAKGAFIGGALGTAVGGAAGGGRGAGIGAATGVGLGAAIGAAKGSRRCYKQYPDGSMELIPRRHYKRYGL